MQTVDCLTLEYDGVVIRECSVWEATRLQQLCTEDLTSGMAYFIDLIPRLIDSSAITIEYLKSQASFTLDLFNAYREWLFNPLTEKDIHELSQDCVAIFEGKNNRKRTPYHDWVTNLFLPLLDNEKGILTREIWPGCRAEQPYKSDLIIRIINSIYCEWATKKRKAELNKRKNSR